MIIYSKTFENNRLIGKDFPVEDVYYASNNEAIVADGITRDPKEMLDQSKYSAEELIKGYPRPSGAELASKEICETFKNNPDISLLDRLVKANENVKKLNDKYIRECNYLDNDYYGAVASCVCISEDILYWAYICDCGVIVYDKNGNIKFQTPDDKEIYSDPYINKSDIPWTKPERRQFVRKEFRNNPNNIVDGKCVSYGAITGEKEAISFIRTGELKLDEDDIVCVYSDGFHNYLNIKEFINYIINFNEEEFINYVEAKSKEDYSKYGSEKTIVILKR